MTQRSHLRAVQALVGVAAVVWCTLDAAAQERLRLEFPEGPVIGSNRVVGLGGAFTGVAEGADGHVYNPSSFAYRYRFTTHQDLDWDWTFYSLTVPGKLNPDVYGPPDTVARTSYTGAAIDMKIHAFGFGLHGVLQDYLLELDDANAGEAREVFVSHGHGGLGFAFVVANLDLRLGAYVYTFDWGVADAVPVEADGRARGAEAISVSGQGLRLGALWEPTWRPLRVGVTLRPPYETKSQTIWDTALFEVAPVVFQPAQLTVGGSVQLWERHFNPYKTWGLKRFERLAPNYEVSTARRYVMLAVDVVLTGAARDAYSVREYFRGTLTPAGTRPTVGLRAGVEGEVLANWLVVRGGTYTEPARTNIVTTRYHGTAGLSLRIPVGELVSFWPWDLRADAAVDLARKFRNFGFGVGIWH